MVISQLWVDDRFRRQGFGAKLLREAETEAVRRGVQSVLVDTFSFQAPGFYERHGYVVYGTVEGFPQAGMIWVRLRKTL
jgi:ribosomal protein S18 acetylase RimI-like enzyme